MGHSAKLKGRFALPAVSYRLMHVFISVYEIAHEFKFSSLDLIGSFVKMTRSVRPLTVEPLLYFSLSFTVKCSFIRRSSCFIWMFLFYIHQCDHFVAVLQHPPVRWFMYARLRCAVLRGWVGFGGVG